MKTDLQLQHDVAAELEFQPSVNAAAIGVEVSDGVVTLSGHVDSHAEKWYAETAAQRVEGVKGLVINLNVELPGPHKRSDADIVRAASEALKWHITIPKDAVQVIVEHGKVTLTGDLSWDYQRRAAEVAMRNLVRRHGKHAAVSEPLIVDLNRRKVRRRRTSGHRNIDCTNLLIASACCACASVRSPSFSNSASRKATPSYLGPSTERVKSIKRETAPFGSARGENTCAPRFKNIDSICRIGSS